MLDVHPPHAAAHTWKDFLIHIATIVIGLFIAVGLEQTVEAIHHASERRELIADLHGECDANLQLLADNIANIRTARAWVNASIATLEDAKPSGGFITVTLPPGVLKNYNTPSRSVWTIAQSNGKAALLPENLGEVFGRLDLQGEAFQKAFDRAQTTDIDLYATYARLKVQPGPGSTLRLTVADRDELVHALSVRDANFRAVAYRSGSWSGVCRAVLEDVQTREEAYKYGQRDANEAIKP